MAQTKYKSPYSCPDCGWMAGDPFEDHRHDQLMGDVYYKFEGDELKLISMDDCRETEQDPPEDYYPKMTDVAPYSNIDGYGYDWKEIWLCPYCKKEFSFNNGT